MARRKYKPTGVKFVDTEFGYVGTMLDEAEDAKTDSIFQHRCRNALTAFYGIGVEVQAAVEDDADDLADRQQLHTAADSVMETYAKRFMRVCAKTSSALGGSRRGRISLRGYEGALPAGGDVFEEFEEDGTDLAERRGGRGRGRRPKDGLQGKGNNCVYDDDGKLVRCFAKMETARKVARGFGSGFRAKKRRG